MNFTAVLKDIRAMQQDRDDRIAELRQQRDELRAALQRAQTRLINADLDMDMRHWTECDRDELAAAQESFDEAEQELKLFLATHAKDL